MRKILPALCIVALLLTMSSWAVGYCLEDQKSVQAEAKHIASPDAGNEWPKFRHDPGNTGATNSPVPTYPYLVWKRRLGGMVTCSPTIVDNTIFVGSWGTSGTSGKLFAINLTTSDVIWTYVSGQYGIHSSPAVDGGKVFVGTKDSWVVALNQATGSEIWNFSTGAAVYSSPAVNGGVVYVASYDAKLYAIDANTGAEKWNTSLLSSSDSSVAYDNGMLYLGDKVGIIHAIYASNGTTAWSKDTQLGDIPSSPAFYNGVIYFSSFPNQTMFAYDAVTGAKKWDKVLSGKVEASAAVHDGNVFITTSDGHIYSLNATDGTTVWNKSGYGKIFSSPTITDGKVLFGSDDGYLRVLDENTGKEVWMYETTAVMDSSPTVYKSYIAIGGNDEMLYVLGYDTQPPKVLATDPINGTKGVPVGKQITMTFNEQINTTSATNGFSIDPATTFNVIWDSTDMIATLNATLLPNKHYNVTAKTSIQDMHGNGIAKDFTFSFDTQDIIAPYVVSTYPANMQENVPFNSKVNVTFSKTMHIASTQGAFTIDPSATGSFSWGASDSVMSFTPTNPLDGDVWYNVTISTAAQDSVGNKMAAPYNFKFHTFDNVGPKVVSTSPKNNDVNVPLKSAVAITFNEPVDEASAKAGVTFTPSVTYTASFSGAVMTMAPSPDLVGDTSYLVTISKVKDVKGNIGLTSSFKFKTIDTNPPTVSSTTPTDGSTGVKVNTNLTIAFSEEMNQTSVESAITFYPSMSFLSKWDSAGSTVTVTPGALFSECAKYYMNVSTGAKDISGNNMTKSYSISFKTAGTCPEPPPTTQGPGGAIWDFLVGYWWILVIIIVVILVLAVAIPGRKTLLMFYGVDEEELKEEKAKKEDEANRCEICYGSLEDEPWIKCKECDRPSHEKCIKKIGKCAYCKAPYGAAGDEKGAEATEEKPSGDKPSEEKPSEERPEEKK